MGVLGVLAGGGLVAAIATDDEPRRATTDGAATVPGGTDVGAPAATTDTTPVADSVTPTTLDDTPLRPNAVRIDGRTYIETTSCVALPNSNPRLGIGDAHIAASMHRVEAVDGQHLVIEQWNEDGFSSIAVAEPDGGYGRAESVNTNAAPTGAAVIESVPMSDDRVVEVEHTLSFAAGQCPSAIVQGDDDFAFDAYGVLDVCDAAEASGLGFIASLHGGTVLHFVDQEFIGEDRGRILGTFADGTALDATFVLSDNTGPIGPGALSADRNAVATLFLETPISSRPCTAADEARFDS